MPAPNTLAIAGMLLVLDWLGLGLISLARHVVLVLATAILTGLVALL